VSGYKVIPAFAQAGDLETMTPLDKIPAAPCPLARE